MGLGKKEKKKRQYRTLTCTIKKEKNKIKLQYIQRKVNNSNRINVDYLQIHDAV